MLKGKFQVPLSEQLAMMCATRSTMNITACNFNTFHCDLLHLNCSRSYCEGNEKKSVELRQRQNLSIKNDCTTCPNSQHEAQMEDVTVLTH